MFTLSQIKEAHSKVKSGADFPGYIQELKKMGITHYETYVSDGHINYFGDDNYELHSAPKYDELLINNTYQEQFLIDLKAHQQGKTDYLTFCADCAKSGVEKWIVDLNAMTCTYFDVSGNNVLVENIPS